MQDLPVSPVTAMACARVLCLVAASLAAPATGEFLQRAGTCPSSSFWVTVENNAAGDPSWLGPFTLSPGECTPKGHSHVKQVKFCGPGTFKMSRMSCNLHDYKAITFEHLASEYTQGDCETIPMADHYQVDGWIGSVTFQCSETAR